MVELSAALCVVAVTPLGSVVVHSVELGVVPVPVRIVPLVGAGIATLLSTVQLCVVLFGRMHIDRPLVIIAPVVDALAIVSGVVAFGITVRVCVPSTKFFESSTHTRWSFLFANAEICGSVSVPVVQPLPI